MITAISTSLIEKKKFLMWYKKVNLGFLLVISVILNVFQFGKLYSQQRQTVAPLALQSSTPQNCVVCCTPIPTTFVPTSTPTPTPTFDFPTPTVEIVTQQFPTPTQERTFCVTDRRLNYRTSPWGHIEGTFSMGTRLEVISVRLDRNRAEWYEIELDMNSYYIYALFCELE